MSINESIKSNKKLLWASIVIILIISSIVIYSKVIKPKIYNEKMSLGIQYLNEGKYEESILAFEKAIKIYDKSTGARIGAAKAYIGVNDIDNAVLKLKEAQSIEKGNEELLKEIIDIISRVDSELAYDFLDKFINEVGKDNISKYVESLLNEAKELPLEPKVTPEQSKYINQISLKLSLDKFNIGHSYYYTLDGTEPGKESNKYRGQINMIHRG